jgi:hypothetical protein
VDRTVSRMLAKVLKDGLRLLSYYPYTWTVGCEQALGLVISLALVLALVGGLGVGHGWVVWDSNGYGTKRAEDSEPAAEDHVG